MANNPKPQQPSGRSTPAITPGKPPTGRRSGANGEPTGVPPSGRTGSIPRTGRSSGGGQRSTRRV